MMSVKGSFQFHGSTQYFLDPYKATGPNLRSTNDILAYNEIQEQTVAKENLPRSLTDLWAILKFSIYHHQQRGSGWVVLSEISKIILTSECLL